MSMGEPDHTNTDDQVPGSLDARVAQDEAGSFHHQTKR
jgi:hypothetical protein